MKRFIINFSWSTTLWTNYDDQFDSLEQQINALAAQANAITQVQSDLSALANKFQD